MATASNNEFKVVGPSSAEVEMGDDVTLPCHLSPEISAVAMEIRWFRETDCICLYKNRQVFELCLRGYEGRVSLFTQEQLERGDVTLEIRGYRDTKGYKRGEWFLCQVINGDRTEETSIHLCFSGFQKYTIKDIQSKTWTEEERQKMEISALMTEWAGMTTEQLMMLLKENKIKLMNKDKVLEEKEQQLKDTGKELDNTVKELEEKDKQLEDLNNKHPKLAQQVSDLQTEVERLKKEASAQMAELAEKTKQQLDQKEDMLAERDQQLQESEKKLEERDKQLEERDKLSKVTNNKLENVTKQLEEKQKHLDEKDTRLENMTKQVSEKERRLEKTVKEVDASKSQLETLGKELQDKNSQLQEMVILLEENKTKLINKDKVLEEKEQQLKDTGKELDNIVKTLEEKDKQLEDLNNKHPKLAQQVSDLQTEVERLKKEASAQMTASPLPQPAPPLVQAAQQAEHPVSSILIPSTEQFKADTLQRKEKELYKLLAKSGRRRLALLINNVKFDCESMLRRGAEKDEENMETLLKALGYDVVKHRDLSGKEMDQAVKAFSEREEHGMSDSTFVVIMSHGKRDAILGVHWDEASPTDDLLPIDKIYTHLNTKHCEKLLNKPKVILIQACRGGDEGSVWVSDSVPEETTSIESDDIRKEHKEKDFISLLSCTPDTKSYRDVEKGTFFVQHIVDVFNAHAHEDHIEELFRKVMRRFEESPIQMACKDRATLMKNFYLFPGL